MVFQQDVQQVVGLIGRDFRASTNDANILLQSDLQCADLYKYVLETQEH